MSLLGLKSFQRWHNRGEHQYSDSGPSNSGWRSGEHVYVWNFYAFLGRRIWKPIVSWSYVSIIYVSMLNWIQQEFKKTVTDYLFISFNAWRPKSRDFLGVSLTIIRTFKVVNYRVYISWMFGRREILPHSSWMREIEREHEQKGNRERGVWRNRCGTVRERVKQF